MSAKLDRPLKPAPVPNVTPFKTGQQNTAPPKAQTFLAPKAQAPTPPPRQAPKPVVTHEQLLEAFNATLAKPDDKALTGHFLKLFVDAENPNFKDENGDCPLFALEVNHRLDLIKAFVANKKFDHGATDKKGKTVLFWALGKTKSDRCPDPLAYVTELLKVVPVNKMDHDGVTLEAYLEKQIASLTRRKPEQAAYLKVSVLPLVKAKIAQENAAFEAEYESRLKVILRRIDQTERDELANNKRVLFRPQDIAAADAQSKLLYKTMREGYPVRLRVVMECKRDFKMITNPEKRALLGPELKDHSSQFKQSISKLSADPEGRQLSNSPTGHDYSGKLVK